MMEDDDRWLETTLVDIQLPCAIQKLANVLDPEEEVFLRPPVRRKIGEIKEGVFNLTRHSRELFGGFEEYIYVGGEGNNPLDIFEKQVLNLAYQVEDATSSFLCRREMRKRRQQCLMKKMMVLFDYFSDQHDNMFKDIKKAKDGFISSSNFGSFDIDRADSLFTNAYMLPRIATGYSDKFGRSNFVCCEEKRGGSTSKEYHLWGYLSIVGEIGSGKTKFARDIYRAVTDDQNQGFEIRAWVDVRPHYKIADIYKDIVDQQKATTSGVPNEIVGSRDRGSKEFSERVKKWLESCRFIIVLDDVHYIWSKIKSRFRYLFPVKTTQCSTVIMTSYEARASEITRVIKVLSPLDEKDSMELFKNTLKKAKMINQIDMLAEDDALNRIETELPREIICKVGSQLPLGIITVARLYMMNKHDNQISSSLPSLIDWDLKYQMLPPRIRQCYLYMGIFPEKFEIPIRRLFRLWIGEGLVVPDSQFSETPEDLALSYLTELETKQLISVNRKNGHPKTCHMPSSIHKFFSRKAMDLGIFYVHNRSENPSSTSRFRRLVEHAADIQQYSTLDDDYKLCSYISLNNRKRDTPAQQVGVFLGKLVAKNGFGLLRVLDLENVYKPLLPAETLEKLFLLTYLGLRWTFLDSLPDSVGTLQYLETLDVKHTNITMLPGTIWKAKNLKHLYMDQVHFDMSINKGFTSSLANLLTLWGLSIGSNKDVVKSLSKLSSLRKLGLTYHSTTAEEIASCISKLANLQSLRLRSLDEGHLSYLKLPADMSMLERLSELYLVGVLSSTNNQTFVQFPPNLKILTLSGSQLKNDSLRILGKLSHLETLRLYAQSYSGGQIIFDKDEFSNLVVLKLWKLVKLETLEMKKGAMSKLEELDIRSCDNLNPMKGLEQVGSLKTITLTNMPGDFVETVKREVKSEVTKDCVVVKVQNLKSSPISTNQSNNNMRGHGGGKNSGGRIVCQLCDGPGHTVHDCLHRFDKKFSGNKSQDYSSAHYSSPDIVVNPEWLPDGDATNHVTADQSNLRQKSKYGGKGKLIIGNRQGYGEGTSTSHT